MNNSAFLGIVEKGLFLVLASDHAVKGSYKLTGIAINAAESPEGHAIDLTKYEGNAIIIRGIESGEWIYDSIVIEEAGLILSALVREIFESGKKEYVPLLKYPWV